MIEHNGLKLIDLDDLEDHVLHTTIYTTNWFETFKDKTLTQFTEEFDYSLILDSTGNKTYKTENFVLEKPFIFVFVPMVEFETTVFQNEQMKTVVEGKEKYTTTRIKTILENTEESLLNAESPLEDKSVMLRSSMVFLFLGETMYRAFSCIPVEVINFINKPIEYQCRMCGTSKWSIPNNREEFIPIINYYKDDNGEISYFCDDCTEFHQLSEPVPVSKEL